MTEFQPLLLKATALPTVPRLLQLFLCWNFRLERYCIKVSHSKWRIRSSNIVNFRNFFSATRLTRFKSRTGLLPIFLNSSLAWPSKYYFHNFYFYKSVECTDDLFAAKMQQFAFFKHLRHEKERRTKSQKIVFNQWAKPGLFILNEMEGCTYFVKGI